jgi:diguanylate cyclase
VTSPPARLTWRGWAVETSAGEPSVTSSRLPASSNVQNRLFPKTRSWFALGAPLELLSPLSVLRVVYPLAAICWLLESVLLGWPRTSVEWVTGASAAAVIVWLGLMFVKELSPRQCHALASLGTVLLTTSIWAARGHATALALLPLFVPLEAFVALFLGARAVVWHLSLAVACLWFALSPTFGVADSFGLAIVTSIAVLSSSLIIRVVIMSASRSSETDPDTGLPNNTGLARLIERRGLPGGLIVASVLLAGVAEAREALGHRVGVELIRRATENLGQVVPAGALIARVGGDELVVAVSTDGPDPGDQVPDAGHVLAGVLSDTVSSGHYLVDRVEVSLRAHVGLAFSCDATQVSELARRASLSAHRAATAGMATTEWDGDHGEMTVEDLALLADLRLADQAGELRLAYQPQVDALTGKTVAVEALLRWMSATHGPISPSRFIVLAERTGLIERLTEWVLREALDTQVRWREQEIDLPVSINLSARMLSRPDLSGWILEELTSRRLPPTALTLEVTETAAADLLEAVKKLRPLHDKGVRISIDDFGTGYTSLAALPYLPLDELKVDMSFVRRLATSIADEAIVRSVRDLASRLGLTSVAEGVETGEAFELLVDIGYDLLQGHHFAPALPERGLLSRLEREAAAAQ